MIYRRLAHRSKLFARRSQSLSNSASSGVFRAPVDSPVQTVGVYIGKCIATLVLSATFQTRNHISSLYNPYHYVPHQLMYCRYCNVPEHSQIFARTFKSPNCFVQFDIRTPALGAAEVVSTPGSRRPFSPLQVPFRSETQHQLRVPVGK